MADKKIFISFVPWLLFSVLINRHGVNAAGLAAAAATALAVILAVKQSNGGSPKLIDVTSIAIFGVMAVACLATVGNSIDRWVADYGRGTAALVLAAMMLLSAITVPFTEQYAREGTPQEYWHSPLFRSINRKISAMWGAAMLVIGIGHLIAGRVNPLSSNTGGSRPADLLLNWGVPIVVVLLALKGTERLSASAGRENSTPTGSLTNGR